MRSDERLNRDRERFVELVQAHDRDLIRVCFVITGDPQSARDAAQDAWQAAWSRRAHLRDPDRVRTWLLAIACNAARQQVRVRRRREHREGDLDIALGNAGESPIRDVDLQRALSSLSAEDRQLLGLKFTAGLNATEISRVTNLSPSGVRVRLHRLMQSLRRELGD